MLGTVKKYLYSAAALFFILFLSLMFEGAGEVLRLDPRMTIPNAILCAVIIFYFCLRVGVQNMFVLCISASIIIAIVDAFNLITVLFLSSIWLGFISYFIFEKYNDESDYLFMFTGVFLLLSAALLVVYISIHKVDFLKTTDTFIKESLTLTKKEFFDPAIKTITNTENRTNLEKFWMSYEKNYPFYIVGGLIVFYIFSYYLLLYLLRRRSKFVPEKPPPFSQFKVKDYYIFVFIVGCVLEILVHLYKNESLKYVSRTVLFFSISCYFVQGVAIVSYYLQKLKAGILSKCIIYFLALYTFNDLTVFVGLFDMWIHFRKFIDKIEEKKSESNTP